MRVRVRPSKEEQARLMREWREKNRERARETTRRAQKRYADKCRAVGTCPHCGQPLPKVRRRDRE